MSKWLVRQSAVSAACRFAEAVASHVAGPSDSSNTSPSFSIPQADKRGQGSLVYRSYRFEVMAYYMTHKLSDAERQMCRLNAQTLCDRQLTGSMFSCSLFEASTLQEPRVGACAFNLSR